MEENQPKTGKYSLNFGLILGAISVAFGVMLYSIDAHTSQSPAIMAVSLVMMLAVVFWGIFNFRKANEGFLSLSQALKLGAGIGLISGIIFILYQMVLVNFLDPEAPAKIMDARMAGPLADGTVTAEQAEQQKKMSLEYWWMGYLFILVVNILIGLVIGLVGGLIFKKSKPAY